MSQHSDVSDNGVVRVSMEVSPITEHARGICWESNCRDEFPFSSVINNEEGTTVLIGPPHSGYKIKTHLKDNKMEGESFLYSDENVLVATLTFVEGIPNGPCTLYNEHGIMCFEGSFINGYRQGRGKEYDENGNKLNDCLFCQGRKYIAMSQMDGYWKEYDDNGNIKSICKKDNEGRNEGLCYFYENGKISKISIWKEGNEQPFSGYFKLFDEPNSIWIEGYCDNGRKLNMIRLSQMDGYWKEYDDNGNIKSICKKDNEGRYEGLCYFYENGKISKISIWKEGNEISTNGSCKIYDEPQKVWYEGYFKDGYRDGKCIEYDEKGKIIYEGFYRNGNRLSRIKEMKSYWKERDCHGNLLRVCQLDEDGRFDGLSYIYLNGCIDKVSRWEAGKEIEVIKEFSGNTMTEFKNGKMIYSGGYRKSILSHYQREGEGKEYNVDGVTLLYEGYLKNGKRNGQGKLYENSNIVYDGEWKQGLKKTHYYFFMTLIFAVMFLIALTCFFSNIYLGTIATGMFITVICFYYNTYAGLSSLGVFIIVMGFLIHIYVGLFVLCSIIIFVSCKFKVYIGCVPAGLILIALSFHFNVYVGIFAIGLFLIYLIFLITYYRKWRMDIAYSSAGAIMLICLIICIIIVVTQHKSALYFLIFAIGLFFIYLIFLITYYRKWKMNIAYSSTGAVLCMCTFTCILVKYGFTGFAKYCLVLLSGLFLIFLVAIYCILAYRTIKDFLKCAGAILGVCLYVCFVLMLIDLTFVKYVVINLFAAYLVFLILGNKGFKEGWLCSFYVIYISILISLIMASAENEIYKFPLVYHIGLIFILWHTYYSGCFDRCQPTTTGILVILTICCIICYSLGANKYALYKEIGENIIIIDVFYICLLPCIDNSERGH